MTTPATSKLSRKSLGTILGTFNKAISDLEKFITLNDSEVQKRLDTQEKLEGEIKEIQDETTLAETVLGNLRKLTATAGDDR